MKHFSARLSVRMDYALTRYEAARGLVRLYWRWQLWKLEREAFA